MQQDLQEIERKANHLIQIYCPQYKLKWMNRKRSLGYCDYDTKEIALSKFHALKNPLEVTRNTVLHEIAHALAGYEANHGPKWKAICRKIGAIPERCAKLEVTGHKWEVSCKCNVYKYYRRPKVGVCAKCFHRFKFKKVA